MIQRSQSVWLLLASACAFLSVKFPFFLYQQHSAGCVNGRIQCYQKCVVAYSHFYTWRIAVVPYFFVQKQKAATAINAGCICG